MRTTTPQLECLNPEQVEQLLADALPEADAAPLWLHAENCQRCMAALSGSSAHQSLLGDLQAMGDLTTTRGLETRPSGPRTGESGWTTPADDAFAGYELRDQISAGGQGVVFRAYQKATKREVAIKVLRSGPGASLAARRRFEREVELAGQLRHPNIVTIFDSGVTNSGERFYVMDFVPGLSLDRYITSAKISRDGVLELVAQICDAVAFAHRHGVIHRDLKPSNILVDSEGRPLILDFGLARKIEVNDADPTETGQVLGTLPYMSPEQAAGDRTTSTLTDVYALGVILYRLLAGQFPYPVDGSPWEVVRHIMSTEPTSLIRRWSPETGVPLRYAQQPTMRCPIDSDLETIVLRALQKEPERRYGSASDLADDLRRFLKGEAIAAKRDSTWYVGRKYILRHKLAVSVVTLLLVALGGFGATTFQALMAASAAQAERDAAKSDAQKTALDDLRMNTRMKLGFFLMLWHQGVPAEQITKQMVSNSAERKFFEALASGDKSSEQLRAELPASDAYLADLLTLERAVAQQDKEAAAKAYLRIHKAMGGTWADQYGYTRIQQLKTQLEDTDASQGDA